METILLAFSFVSFIKGLLVVFFVLTALLLTLVVLLQEPKGGGLSSAFGGAGAESFGVQSRGVNKFTAYTAGVFMFLAVLYAAIPEGHRAAPSDTVRSNMNAPAEGGEGVGPGEGAPAEGAPAEGAPGGEGGGSTETPGN